MPEFDCTCDHAPQSPRVILRRVDSNQHVHVCTDALRAVARLKADVHDRSGQMTLTEHAQENDWGLWRSEHILYLIPSIAPFGQPAHDHPLVPAPLTGAGDGT